MMSPVHATVAIDAQRLQRRLAELAAIGAIDGTDGCARLALTDDDRAGRELVVTWMRDLGLSVVDRRRSATSSACSAPTPSPGPC